MATVSAVYGAGLYGSSEYGVVNVTASVTGVSATGAIQAVAVNGFEIDISEVLQSAVSTGSIGIIKPNIALPITGVSGATAVNDAWSIRSVKTATATGVQGTTALNGDFNFVVTIGPFAGVSGSGQIGSLGIPASEPLESVAGTTALGTITATGVVFDFEAVKTQYSRARTTFLPQQEPRIVYVGQAA